MSGTTKDTQNEQIANQTRTNTDADDAGAEPPAGFSRYPADYVPTDHFLQRFDEDTGTIEARTNPRITGAVIETCIRDGELKSANGDRWVLEADVDGVMWWLVVGIHEGRSNDVLTAYAPDRHQLAGGPERDQVGGGGRK